MVQGTRTDAGGGPGTNTVVLLAGGVGSRVGLDIPKQLIKIAGAPIMEHTLRVFESHPDVDDIIILMAPGHLDAVRAMVSSGGYTKVRQLLEGAATRSETSIRALEAVPYADGKVLLHDAVRPLVSPRIVADCFRALDAYDAVDVAIPSADTIIEVTAEDTIAAVPRRSALRRGQTPQAFRLSTIREAYARATADPAFEATDDCTVVLRYLPDVPIYVVPGEERNMKVTDPIDVYLADKLFQLTSSAALPTSRDDAGYREALADRTLVVFGGSYGIGADIARLAERYGARVCSFSRSTTRTHVERRDDVRRALDEALARHGSVDFVVNAAGVLPRGTLLETSEETVYNATEVNYLAPVFIAQEAYPHLEKTRGSLLLFTSSSYTRGRSGYSLYSSAKAAVVNLTQALADEWASAGVRVNCVNPERTSTPMRVKAFGEEPAGSLLGSEEVARASLDTLLGSGTGHVIDLRKSDPLALD